MGKTRPTGRRKASRASAYEPARGTLNAIRSRIVIGSFWRPAIGRPIMRHGRENECFAGCLTVLAEPCHSEIGTYNALTPLPHKSRPRMKLLNITVVGCAAALATLPALSSAQVESDQRIKIGVLTDMSVSRPMQPGRAAWK